MRGKGLDPQLVKELIVLRSKGYSVPELSRSFNIPKTTVFRYVRDIKILPKHIDTWLGKRGGSRKRKLLREKYALEEGKKIIGNLTEKEKLLYLSALYWAEGSKASFGLSNTDPELVRIFITGLREIFKVQEDRFRISVRIYEDLDRERCLDFWSKVVSIPKEKFVSVDVLEGKKKGRLEFGMCRVRVLKGADLLKKIVAVNKLAAGYFIPIA